MTAAVTSVTVRSGQWRTGARAVARVVPLNAGGWEPVATYAGPGGLSGVTYADTVTELTAVLAADYLAARWASQADVGVALQGDG